MYCFACENEAQQQCQRCQRLYCENHGDNLCGECLNPASAVPSPAIYRGSLLALIVGTAVVAWLLLAPPALPGDAVEVGENPEVEDVEPTSQPFNAPADDPSATPSSEPQSRALPLDDFRLT